MSAVTGPLLEIPVPWEYPIGVWAFVPWLGRPMTPHFCNRQPGECGRSHTSSFELCMRRWHRALLGPHDVPRRDGRHIRSAVAADTSG